MFVIFAFVIMILCLFMGLAIDMGMYFRERSVLAKTVDGVVVRVTNRVSATTAERRKVIEEFFRANVSGYEGAFSWASETIDGKVFDAATVGTSKVAYNYYSSQDIVQMELRASKVFPTHFMRLAGINEMPASETAVAERFPGIIILVLDVSGSMRGTGDNSKWFRMAEAAKEFVQSDFFSEERDRFAIFLYGTRAVPLYPEPTAANLAPHGYVTPSLNYRTGAGSALNKLSTGSSGVRPDFGFNGSTSASEGMRIAFESVESYLANDVGVGRENYKVSYVFLTDGDFNTLRTWAVGRGYGWPTTVTSSSPDSSSFLTHYERRLNESASNQFSSSQTSIAYSSFNWTGWSSSSRRVPSWHGTKLINASTYGSRNWGQLTNFTRPGAGNPGPYNLNTLFNKSFDTMPGISVGIHAQEYYRADTGFGRWGMKTEQARTWPSSWNGVLFEPDGSYFIPRYGTSGGIGTERTGTTSSTDDLYMRWNASDPTSQSTSYFYNNATMGRIRWEMLQSRYGYLLSVPESVMPGDTSSSNNPTTTAAKTLVSHRSGINMTNDWLSFYNPAGRIFGNMYGSPDKANAGTRGVYVEKTNTGGMTDTSENFAYDSFNRAFARLTDYYPDFYYGLHYADLSSTDRTWLENTNNWRRTDGNSNQRPITTSYRLNSAASGASTLVQSLGYPRYLYRPSTGTWVRNDMHNNDTGAYTGTTMDGVFLDEGNFLAEAQCYIARIHQKATIYTIGYDTGSGPAAVLQRMANHDSIYNDPSRQNEGLFQQATTTNISAVFQQIASKIAISITK